MDGLDYMEEQAPEAMDDIKKKIQYTTDDQNPVLLVVRLKRKGFLMIGDNAYL